MKICINTTSSLTKIETNRNFQPTKDYNPGWKKDFYSELRLFKKAEFLLHSPSIYFNGHMQAFPEKTVFISNLTISENSYKDYFFSALTYLADREKVTVLFHSEVYQPSVKDGFKEFENEMIPNCYIRYPEPTVKQKI